MFVQTVFAAAVALASALPGTAASTLEPVPASEVKAWAERGSFWCMNPSPEGVCQFATAWTHAANGGFRFVAAEVVDPDGSLFIASQPFTLDDDRQCYRVDPATIEFGSVGNADSPGMADARRRWQIGLEDEKGDIFCMAFLRDRETGLVHRRQWQNGVERANPVDEVWQVSFSVDAIGGAGK